MLDYARLAGAMVIAPEARGVVAAALIAAVAGTYWFGGYWAILIWIGLGLLVFVFRDPARVIPAAPLGVVSPIDGRVVDLREDHDELLDRAAVVVRIQQSWGAILTWRYPIEGRIIKIWWNDRPKNPDSRNKPIYTVHIRTDEKHDVLTSFGRTGGGINSFNCQPGERVAQGRRAGYAGIRRWVDVSLPAQSRIEIELGASVKGGADVIATLVH